jgi:uncharacterized membrane protein (DUF2068 family)
MDKRRGLLPYIAAFKIVKAGMLIVVGAAALRFVGPDSARRAEGWLAHVASPLGREFVQRVLTRALRLGPGKLAALGIGAWLYAALFVVEGVGLWRQRRWAEYLTIVATASFIPFEIYELVQEVSAAKATALVLNIAIVLYLVVRVRRSG